MGKSVVARKIHGNSSHCLYSYLEDVEVSGRMDALGQEYMDK